MEAASFGNSVDQPMGASHVQAGEIGRLIDIRGDDKRSTAQSAARGDSTPAGSANRNAVCLVQAPLNPIRADESLALFIDAIAHAHRELARRLRIDLGE